MPASSAGWPGRPRGEDRAARLLAPGIADHDVEPAELVHRLLHQVSAEALVAQVAGDRGGLAAGLSDQVHHLAGVRLLGGQVVDGDVGAFAGIGAVSARGPGRCSCRLLRGVRHRTAGDSRVFLPGRSTWWQVRAARGEKSMARPVPRLYGAA
jgi:hypothetical protein